MKYSGATQQAIDAYIALRAAGIPAGNGGGFSNALDTIEQLRAWLIEDLDAANYPGPGGSQ